MLVNAFKRSAVATKSLLKKSGDHHHELTIFTEGPPKKGQILRWMGFLTLGPTMMAATLYGVYVGPRIKYVLIFTLSICLCSSKLLLLETFFVLKRTIFINIFCVIVLQGKVG